MTTIIYLEQKSKKDNKDRDLIYTIMLNTKHIFCLNHEIRRLRRNNKEINLSIFAFKFDYFINE